jgi:hypothetical protein
MNREMVLASMGAPASKVRETNEAGERYEEWIYGHQPQTMHFVRFVGDRVSLVKIAALGKPIEVHDQDEMAGYLPPPPTVAVGDVAPAEGKATPPTLKLPDEDKTPTDSSEQNTTVYRKVQMPEEKKTPSPPPNAVPDDTPAEKPAAPPATPPPA